MNLQMERRTLYRHDYSQKLKTKDICTLSEQSKTDCLQMETQKSDTLNNNITFGQCKYNSYALEDTPINSSTTFGGFFSKHSLQRCRLCTVPRPIMMLTSIFDNHCANRYLKMIEMYLPIKMHKNDGLPHYICSSCFEKLDHCYDSLNKFRNAYKKHREKIILTDEQTPVPVSSGTKSSESNNIDKDIQNDNKIQEANLLYSKLLPSQNDRISHNLSEHLLESEININKQADTHAKKTVVKNNENQCGNMDENIQNNGQSLDFIVELSDSENDGQVNHFSATECASVNTDTTDVCSVMSDTTLNNIKVADNDTAVSKLRLKKINELTYNTESNKMQHRDNSRSFTENIVSKENTPSAAPLKRSTNDNKTLSVDKIKLIYECSFCRKIITSKKKLIAHCISVHKTSKDEKITCRQLKTIITGNGIEPSPLLNDENIRMDNTDSESVKYAYECGQCLRQLPTKEDLVSHCVANKCFNAQNKIVCRQVKLKSTPTEVRYKCNQGDATFTEPRARVMHSLECHSEKNTAQNSNKDEPAEVRYKTGDGTEPSPLLNDDNMRMNNTDVDRKDSKSVKYAYECCQCLQQLPTKEDLVSHCVANKCFNAQNRIVCRQIKLKSTPNQSEKNTAQNINEVEPGEVRYKCNKCNVYFTEHRARVIHMLAYHSKKSKTNIVARANETLEHPVTQHSKSHTWNSSCLCMYCGVTRTNKRLIQHERIHTNERPHECAVCLKTFRTPCAYAKHKEIHSNQKNYICHQCGRACRTKHRLSQHMKTHMPMEERPFQCEVCDKRFGRSDHYKRHKMRHTEIVTELKCSICHKVFNSGPRLNVHIRRAHVNNVQYTCEECGKTFRTKYKFTTHVYLHTGEKPYKCNICDKAFRCRATRRQHSLVHKSDAPYACDVCEKRFKRAGHLKLHKQTHSSDKPHICLICGKAFRHKQNLNDHHREHTGERPYKCDICDKAFRCQSTRHQHALVHQSDAPYGCEICGRRFKRAGHLKLHRQTHSSCKSYICLVCGKAFQRKQGLSDHQKEHTGVELQTETVVSV